MRLVYISGYEVAGCRIGPAIDKLHPSHINIVLLAQPLSIVRAERMDQKNNQQIADLLAQTALGDRKAFENLYQQTSSKLFGILIRILNREALAQDCLQDAYVKIWQKAGDYRQGKGTPLTWMGTIARNTALDLLRKQRDVQQLDDEVGPLATLADTDPMPIETMVVDESNSRLDECLKSLNENQRQCIALAYYRGLSHDQLAKQLDLPLGTIKTWIRRGLEQLKRCFK